MKPKFGSKFRIIESSTKLDVGDFGVGNPCAVEFLGKGSKVLVGELVPGSEMLAEVLKATGGRRASNGLFVVAIHEGEVVDGSRRRGSVGFAEVCRFFGRGAVDA